MLVVRQGVGRAACAPRDGDAGVSGAGVVPACDRWDGEWLQGTQGAGGGEGAVGCLAGLGELDGVHRGMGYPTGWDAL